MKHSSAAGAILAGMLLVRTAAAGDAPRLVFESQRFPNTQAEENLRARLLAVTDIGNLRLVLSNSGTFGTSFQARDTPSMEWPARSGHDHLVRGALWVGAISQADGDTLVTMGGRDAYYLDAIFQHSEFTPVQGRPREYSRLRTSPFFRSDSTTVSDEHFHTVYVDTFPIVKLGGGQAHGPLGIRIVQNAYSWSFDPLDDFVIVEFTIVNISEAELQRMWIGFYSELVSNNRLQFTNWPPGGAWFDFQLPEWDETRHMLTNYHTGGGRGANEIAAVKLLGSGGFGPFGRGRDSLSTKQISLTAWSWAPTQFLIWRDPTLYEFMSTGQAGLPQDGVPDPDNPDVNPVTVFSVGPFNLLPGDSTQAVFAFLVGSDRADLERNAFWAQKAYDDRYAVPSPPSSPILRVYPRNQEVVLRWSAEPESDIDPASRLRDFQGYRVYMSTSPLAASFQLLRQLDLRDGVGFDTGLDSLRLDEPFIDDRGDSLWYELQIPGIPNGFKRYVAVSSYDFQVGDPPTLEGGVLQNSTYFIAGPDAEQAREGGHRVSVFPNPYRGESAFDIRNPDGTVNPRRRVLWFVNLPQRAHIRIYTLAGDVVREYEFDAATYRGSETAGISPDRADLANKRFLVTSGTMAGFDLLNSDGQQISSGLYLFSVRDRDSGETQQGKFMVMR